MGLDAIPVNFGRGLAFLFGRAERVGSLFRIVRELQGLTVAVVAGTTSATNIAITGINTEDTILSVVRHDLDGTAANIDVDDLTSEASITSAGNIQLSATNTTGDKLIVTWFNKTP